MSTAAPTPALLLGCNLAGLAVARSLAERGIPVVGVDRDPRGAAFASRHLIRRAVCPSPRRPQRLLAFLANLAEELGGAVVIPTQDAWLEALAAGPLPPSLRLVLPGVRAADLLDKVGLYRAARAAGIPLPASWEDPSQAALPCLLKARRAGAPRVRLVRTAAQLERLADSPGAFLAQELVPHDGGGLVSACVFRSPQGTWTFTARKLRQRPPRYGTAAMVASEPWPEPEGLARRLLETLDYQGLAQVEFVRDQRDGQWRLLDLNPRPWKWLELTRHAGVDFAYLAYAATLGLPLPPSRQTYGARWLHLGEYLGLAPGRGPWPDGSRLTAQEWGRLLVGLRPPADCHLALWDPADPEPALAYLTGLTHGTGYSGAC
ncbi:MAG: hypothetical protein M0031_05395 [Thermaerobacter sp.]|jgi:predicted ATP-grasp superfamily ATP-dependent carboligase|nr:hypothetical protein [Thermaerobacter sp.]